MGSVLSFGLSKIATGVSFAIFDIIWPLTKLILYFMGFVLIITFVGNIAGILGFFLFLVMFYYYVKGIIFIEPSS
jgi:hypothetical protein